MPDYLHGLFIIDFFSFIKVLIIYIVFFTCSQLLCEKLYFSMYSTIFEKKFNM